MYFSNFKGLEGDTRELYVAHHSTNVSKLCFRATTGSISEYIQRHIQSTYVNYCKKNMEFTNGTIKPDILLKDDLITLLVMKKDLKHWEETLRRILSFSTYQYQFTYKCNNGLECDFAYFHRAQTIEVCVENFSCVPISKAALHELTDYYRTYAKKMLENDGIEIFGWDAAPDRLLLEVKQEDIDQVIEVIKNALFLN